MAFYRNEANIIEGAIKLNNDIQFDILHTRLYIKPIENVNVNGNCPTTLRMVIPIGKYECIVTGKNIYVIECKYG